MIGIAGDFGKRLQIDSCTAAGMAFCFADAMLAEDKAHAEKEGSDG